MKFVIFHGSFGSPECNWFPNLKEKLEVLGQEVLVPKFPCDDFNDLTKSSKTTQNLFHWLKIFEKKVLPKIRKDKKLCFIGHSIAPVFILHIVLKFNLPLDCAFFVSPFMEDIKSEFWQFYLVNRTFYKTNFDFNKLKKLIPLSYVLYSDNDPYVDKKYSMDFANKLNSKKIIIKDGGHLNSESGYTRFPLLIKLCQSLLNN